MIVASVRTSTAEGAAIPDVASGAVPAGVWGDSHPPSASAKTQPQEGPKPKRCERRVVISMPTASPVPSYVIHVQAKEVRKPPAWLRAQPRRAFLRAGTITTGHGVLNSTPWVVLPTRSSYTAVWPWEPMTT